MRASTKILTAIASGIAVVALSACTPQINIPVSGIPDPGVTSSAPETTAPAAPETTAPVESTAPAGNSDAYCAAVEEAFTALTTAGEEMNKMSSNPDLPKMGKILTETADKMDAAAALATGEAKSAMTTLGKAFRDFGKAALEEDQAGLLKSAQAMTDEKFMDASVDFAMEAALKCKIKA